MYKQLYIKTESEKEFLAACEKVDLTDDGEVITSSKDYAMDVIGGIRMPTGEAYTDDDGNELPIYAPIEGYHVNIKTKIKLGLEHLAIDVGSPQRKFAGD